MVPTVDGLENDDGAPDVVYAGNNLDKARRIRADHHSRR
jgi:hypothetical protein